MSSTIRTITPDSEHPSYKQAKEGRALSLAFREGPKAFIRDAQNDRNWIKPEPGENEITIGDLRFNPFKERYERLRFDDVYKECIQSNASDPFMSKLTHHGWPDNLFLRLKGQGRGVDGKGTTVGQFYHTAFENKLFAAVDYARIALDGPIPLWRHVLADDLLDWSYDYVDGIFKWLGANISTQGGSGRLTFTIENGKVIERKYTKKSDVLAKISKEMPMIPNGKEQWEQEGEDIIFAGLDSCPVFAFSVTDAPGFTDTPLFDAAAITQLRIVELRSHLDRYEVDVLMKYLMTITGWKGSQSHKNAADGELVEPEKLPLQGRALAFSDKDTKVGNYQVDPGSIDKILEDIRHGEASVRRQCLDAQRITDSSGDVKATEMRLHTARRQTLISTQVSYDMATLTEMAKATSTLMGSVPEADASISMEQSFFEHPDHAVVDKVAEYAEKDLVDKTFFLDVAEDNLTSIDPRHWEELRKRVEAGIGNANGVEGEDNS